MAIEVELEPLFRSAIVPAFEFRYFPEDKEGARLPPIDMHFVRSVLDGGAVYLGVPLDKRGVARARGVIIMKPDAMMIGPRALSYVLSGGWASNNATQTRAGARAAKDRLFTTFWQALLAHSANKSASGPGVLGKTLSAFLQVAVGVEAGILSPENLADLQDLGCPQWLADALVYAEVVPRINPSDVANRFVKGAHTTGPWTADAELQAACNSLTMGVTQYLKRHSITYPPYQGRISR